MQASADYDLAVLGAGAAGMFAAALAGARGMRVVLVEAGDKVGRKILISGGGRCNFTNLRAGPANFLSENPHFAKSALARYTPQNFIALVERYGIPYHEKTLGQLFCDGSAQAIVSMLRNECREANVEVRTNTRVDGVESSGTRFTVRTSAGPLRAGRVAVATGGLSIPKLGATGVGYDIARSFGLGVVDPRAALVPFTLHEGDRLRWCDLAGVSAEAVVTLEQNGKGRRTQAAFREKILITHRGFSGPAMLQISSFWQPGQAVHVDLAPATQVFTPLLASPAQRDLRAAARLRELLPQRLAERWMREHTPADWKNASLLDMESAIHAWPLLPAGTEGFAKAEVTAGGVSTADLDSTTMQAKRTPNLAFIGEVVDVTGWLGGYNFQWAWASAYAAAQSF